VRRLQQRSDRRGLLRLAGHLAAMGGTGWLHATLVAQPGHAVLDALASVAYGFTLVTMFAAMHESIHRTAFKTRWLNDAVGWCAGVLSFYNSTFYRHYHGWHHRFTQIRGRDPELEDPKPTNVVVYVLEIVGYYWWVGKLRTYAAIARGRVGGYPFLNENTGREVIRSVRAQLLLYGLAMVASVVAGRPLFVTFWLLPVAVAQPLLRAILMAEHTGCTEDDNPLTNTRTTYTIFPVRFLMWDMPFHAEHHRYPALPFFALGSMHEAFGPGLAHVGQNGYLGFHVSLLRRLFSAAGARSAPPPS
jgi:fatty acid desaturase